VVELDRALVDVGRREPQRLTDVVRGELGVLLEEFVARRPVCDHPNEHGHGDAGSPDARDAPMIWGSTLIRGNAMEAAYGTGAPWPMGGVIGCSSEGRSRARAERAVDRGADQLCGSLVTGTRWPYWSAVVWIVA
jgi:hypothetical protein